MRGRGGHKDADGNGSGIGGKRRRKRSRGCNGRRRRHIKHNTQGSRHRGSERPRWGRKKRQREGCGPAGKLGRQFLRSWRRIGGAQGLQSGKKPQGGLSGSGRGIQVAEGHRQPRSGRIAWGDEKYGVTNTGNGVPGIKRQGWGGDGNSSATWDTKGSTVTCCGAEMASGMEPAAPSITPRGMAEGESSGITIVSTQRHSDGADSARLKYGALARRKYGLLAPEGSAGN